MKKNGSVAENDLSRRVAMTVLDGGVWLFAGAGHNSIWLDWEEAEALVGNLSGYLEDRSRQVAEYIQIDADGGCTIGPADGAVDFYVTGETE